MKKILEFIKTQIPFEIKRPSSLLSIIISLVVTGFFIQVGAKICDSIGYSISPYIPKIFQGILQIITFSISIKVNLITGFIFTAGFFTVYRIVDKKILQKLGEVKIFEDDFDSENYGWQLDYWGSNNPGKTCIFSNSCIVFEAKEKDLVDNKKEYGAYFDLTTGIYGGSKYVISCWVKSEENTSMGFKLWVHDMTGKNEVKFPARFYTPGNSLEEIKVGFTATTSQALRIHLHNKAGNGKIFVDKVKVVKVE